MGASSTQPATLKPLSAARKRLQRLERKARPKRPWVRKPPALVSVTLTRRHSINDRTYGPGVVSVSREIAEVLIYQEQNAQREELRFRDPDPMARAIGAGGRVYLVSPDSLDAVLGQGLVLAGTLSGR